MNMYINKLF